MPATDQIRKETILAILREARDAGFNTLTRTSLVKYVYLLDVFVADESNGTKRWTDFEWTFLHYGPFSTELAACLDSLEAGSFVEKEERSSGEKEFVLYHLAERSTPRQLIELGIPQNASMRLGQALREFAYSLPRLLDYVYFKTAPMASAVPKQVLRFDQCRAVNYRNEIKPLTLVAPNKEQVKRLRELIATIAKRNLPSVANPLANVIYDEHYSGALQGDDSNSSVDVKEILASLEFRNRDDDGRA